jgi:hypothetical protein
VLWASDWPPPESFRASVQQGTAERVYRLGTTRELKHG